MYGSSRLFGDWYYFENRGGVMGSGRFDCDADAIRGAWNIDPGVVKIYRSIHLGRQCEVCVWDLYFAYGNK